MSSNIECQPLSFREQRRRLLMLPFAIAALKLLPACFDSEERRLESLKQNVVVFQRSEDRGLGTAIRLCESGYYLTAAHLLIKDRSEDGTLNPITSGAHLYHPLNGNLFRIKNFIMDTTTDLAVLYAPSGKKRKKTDVQLSIESLEPKSKLWLLGSVLEQQGNNFQASLLISFGKVDELSAPANFEGENVYLSVKDMIPFGGSSGGPIIDEEGKVVAIESGFYVETSSEEPVEKVRRNYTHSIISPLTNLRRIYDEKINTLPVSRPIQ